MEDLINGFFTIVGGVILAAVVIACGIGYGLGYLIFK